MNWKRPSFAGAATPPADLGALTDNGLEAGRGYRCRLHDVAYLGAPPDRTADRELPKRAVLALEKMQDLATGHRILPLQEAADAGRIHHEVESPRPVYQRRLAPVIAQRFFGTRATR